MIKNTFKYFGVALVSSIGFLSCDKNDEGTMNGAGRTIVKIDEAADEKYAIVVCNGMSNHPFPNLGRQ